MFRLGVAVAASTVALCAAAPIPAVAVDARPVTIPALRHFRAGEGHLSLRRDPRVRLGLRAARRGYPGVAALPSVSGPAASGSRER